MGTVADFVIMTHEGDLEWIGRLYKQGDVFSVPRDFVFSSSREEYIAKVEEMIDQGVGTLSKDEAQPETDIAHFMYAFHECTNDIYVSAYGSRWANMVSVLRGQDLYGADIGLGRPDLTKVK